MKRIKLRYVALAALFCCFSFSSVAQEKLSLEKCIEIALANNRNIKQQQLTQQQRAIAYNQARADLLPNLNASMGQNFVFGRSIGLDNTYQNTNSQQTSFGVNSNITLFDGLKMKHNIDARKADLAASGADLEKMEDDIVMSVSTAFLQTLLTKELLQIAVDQLEVTKANIARASELVKSGKMAQGELYEIEAQAAREDLSLVQAENNLKLALLDLAQIMEMETFENFDIVAPSAEALISESTLFSSDAVYESALVNRPEIRGAQFRLESGKKELAMAKSQYMPTLSFGAQMGTGYYRMSSRGNESFGSQIRNNISNTLGFSLSIPIFNRFQIRNGVKNAEIALESSKLNIDKTKIELRKSIEQAYYNAVGAQSRWKAAQKSETASREAYRYAEQKYENGRATSYELFQAKSSLAQVLGEQAQAKYEYAFRLKILELLKN